MEPYKARHVAQATHRLSREAAAYVDEQLAARLPRAAGRRSRPPSPTRSRSHPELLEEREKQGAVLARHAAPPPPSEYAGTSWLDITGDTLDLTAFHDLVCDQAAALKALGDTDDLEVRKAKALGVIAAQQAQLDLTSLSPDSEVRPAAPRTPKTRFYLHLNLADLATHGCSGQRPGRGHGRGSAPPPSPIKEWVGHSQVTVSRSSTSAAPTRRRHEPPAWMRELVILRDGHCVFPWCHHDARTADLDHIDPYIPIDEGGPPGQTIRATSPLVPATSPRQDQPTMALPTPTRQHLPVARPHGRSYLVTPHGTLELPATELHP
ncbi:HNH endonuclease signature motif containing protein [Nocardioides ungokensis]|uniref:HNH endonuclease signature motif containing protein n=1 Tax=Nocardioides ungokensis TaxID=1643322 RepID=UPI0015DF0E78|nr:HNH endonuclease signature motif containing protein [Nocardioides ungokensis]